jgi:capsular polysaccharide biosynthesis protein
MDRRNPDDPEALGRADAAGRDSSGARSRAAGESAMWTDDDFTASGDYAPEYGGGEYGANLAISSPSRPALVPAIRRRAWVWCLCAVVGLVLGAAALKAIPPPYKATTSVLVTQSPSLPPTDQILTEVALVQSRTVALVAMRSLGLPISDKAVESFSAAMTVTSVTDRVIQITVKGTNSSAAVSAARAAAAAFLNIRDAELRSAEQLTTAALTRQINDGKAREASLTAKIAELPKTGLTTEQQTELASLTSKLRSQKASLTGLVTSAAAYESDASVTTSSMIHGSQVLDPASAIPRSHLRYPVLYLGGGLFGGLAVGIGVVVLLALVSRRLRRRDDVARALGGPVQLSVGNPGRLGLLGRPTLAAAQRPAVRQIVSHLRKSLPLTDRTATMAVVAVDDARVPALALVSLASAYARAGKRVLISDLTPGQVAGRLLNVTEVGVRLTKADGHEVLLAIPDLDSGVPDGPVDQPDAAGQLSPSPFDTQVDKAFRTADIMLTLVDLDPAQGADHLPTWADDAVVMVTAGESSVMKVHAIGEMIRVSGTALTCAILIGADRGDESLGFTQPSAEEPKPEFPAPKLPPVAKRPAQDPPSQQPQPQSLPQPQPPQVQQPQVQQPQAQHSQPRGGGNPGPDQGGRGPNHEPRATSNGDRIVASLATGKGRPDWVGDGEAAERE